MKILLWLRDTFFIGADSLTFPPVILLIFCAVVSLFAGGVYFPASIGAFMLGGLFFPPQGVEADDDGDDEDDFDPL
jgi:hypothetical protein